IDIHDKNLVVRASCPHNLYPTLMLICSIIEQFTRCWVSLRSTRPTWTTLTTSDIVFPVWRLGTTNLPSLLF
ncbi:MAG: hypothetical protein ACKO9G_19305, partial [Dolichospermum sp.]